MKTTPAEIVAYWSSIKDESALSVDWAEADLRCWRCAQETNLERCHVIPHALGGSEHPSNLVLLCGKCHREAPNVSDPQFMWLWLEAHATPHYGTYWYTRGLKEFELIFGRHPFSGIDEASVSQDALRAAVAQEMEKAIVHFGEGRLNPSTIAWLFFKVEQTLSGEQAPISRRDVAR